MFEILESAPADPILGLTDAFKKDTRSEKVNLGVGVYKDNFGQTPILDSVKKAESLILETQKSKSYLGITGLEEYGKFVRELLFSRESSLVEGGRAITAQVPGGTGALRIASEFCVRKLNCRSIWISNPTWANHHAVFKEAGLEVKEYQYYDAANKTIDFAGMKESLSQAQEGDVILLHGCCHNPTGIDPTNEQWDELAKLTSGKGCLPFFDFAYQGFSAGIEEDAYGLRAFTKTHSELIVASSFSKNFGLYNERIGALTLVAKDDQMSSKALGQVKLIIRRMYSNPPAHGAQIVSQVLKNEDLKNQWIQEVDQMRSRIKEMRQQFVSKLSSLSPHSDFSFIEKQNGMFSFSGLNREQVQRLKDEFAIYIVGSGRINVAGMTQQNIDYLCESIAKVL